MEVLVTTESRFFRDPMKRIYPEKNPYIDYNFWRRYLEVFDNVLVTGRVEDISYTPELPQANGPGVSFVPLPTWNSPWEHLRKRSDVRRILREASRHRAVCLRAPVEVSNLLYPILRERAQPYGVEVVGDPWDSFSRDSLRTWLWPLLRWKSYLGVKKLCRNAVATAYVTEKALQRRYPPSPGTFTTHFSSIVLQEGDFVSEPRRTFFPPFHLVHVGSMAKVLYKGQDIILHAYKEVRERLQYEVTLTFVGEGERRSEIEELAAELRVSETVRFTGLLPGPRAVQEELDRADLFLLPSRTEGLPKAMVEAMARGLPAIGTSVGGIPELIDERCLIPPNDVNALASKIITLIENPTHLAEIAARNLQRARDFHIQSIRKRRDRYYKTVLEMSSTWMRGQ